MALPFGLKPGLQAKTNVTIGEGDKRETVEFGAVCLANAVVYKVNGKPIKTAEVPEEVKAQLIGTMLAGSTAVAEVSQDPTTINEVTPVASETFLHPTVIDEAANLSEEDMKAIETIAPQVTGGTIITTKTTHTTENPFHDFAKDQEAENEAMRIAHELESLPVPNPQYQPSAFENAPIEDTLGFDASDAPIIDYPALLEEAEARSVDNVNLKVLVEVLYRRFRVYLPYLNIPPQRTDISPLTGMVMNAITFGQAVQGFKTAQRSGASWNPNVIRTQLESSRSSTVEEEFMPRTNEELAQEVTPYGQPLTGMPDNLHGEPEVRVNRNYDSPHHSAQYSMPGKESDGLDEDELYAEPPINARNAIIRPFHPNKEAQVQLEEINRQRLSTIPTSNFSDLV